MENERIFFLGYNSEKMCDFYLFFFYFAYFADCVHYIVIHLSCKMREVVNGHGMMSVSNSCRSIIEMYLVMIFILIT